MTLDEVRMALALGECRFLPGSFDKRFAHGIASRAECDAPTISAGEASLVRKFVVRYRRQVSKEVVGLARFEAPPVPPDPPIVRDQLSLGVPS